MSGRKGVSVTKREVVQMVLAGKKPPYVPWSYKFTHEPEQMLKKHFVRVKKNTACWQTI